ncbi:hypothetical protein [Pseudomonas fluorescens]|uniref:Uncharacterized protein n=1 Tax=Pseudomonas fluorescens TaxID=294 RepID=A0A0F4SPC1_PSEFL|nr:hypothetical protein [Pseudomonas fluorescens]KJZ33764.1 hypothetical protein VC34_29505 [Pseudomonas fluorescens]
MIDELMTTAVCWDMKANVSVEFAHTAEYFFYFCPDLICLERVVPVVRKNYFFRAPQAHAPGCHYEKKRVEASSVPGVPKQRESLLPPSIIPSHLGKISPPRQRKLPSKSEMRSLSEQIKTEPPLHPGTLQEVIDSWLAMSTAVRSEHPLVINGRTLDYFTAFSAFNSAKDDPSLLVNRQTIAFGMATVSHFINDFYITSRCKFLVGEQYLPIKIRVRPGDPDFDSLADKQNVLLFIYGNIALHSAERKWVEMQRPDAYSGFVISHVV